MSDNPTIRDSRILWGTNVDLGFTGLISRKKDFISAGINWFERWDRLPKNPPVSHAFIITGQDETIEAFGNGVHYGKLTDYLHDQNVALLVRRPLNWTPEIGEFLCSEATKHLGDRYNFALIAALALSNTFVGHAINRLTRNRLEETLTQWADNSRCDICSQLVSKVMRSWYGNIGILTQPDRAITPQEILSATAPYQGPPVELLPPLTCVHH